MNNPETDMLQEWCVLKNDNTLKRAIEKSKLSNIKDYQKDQLDTAISHCKKFRTAIDIGANYGVMSFNISKIFSKVYAFEIVPDINFCLKENIKNLNMKNVVSYDCGLGDQETKVSLNFNSTSTFSTHVNDSENNNTDKVDIKKLDSFGFSDVDFIKIDTEGYEPFVIMGGLETIIKYKPVILYERKGHEKRYGMEKNSVLDILSKYGYKELENIGSKNALIGVR